MESEKSWFSAWPVKFKRGGNYPSSFLKKVKNKKNPQITRKCTTTKPLIKCSSPSKPLSPKAYGLTVCNDWQHFQSQEKVHHHHLFSCAWNYGLKITTRNNFFVTRIDPEISLPSSTSHDSCVTDFQIDSANIWFHEAKKGQLRDDGLFIKSCLWLYCDSLTSGRLLIKIYQKFFMKKMSIL